MNPKIKLLAEQAGFTLPDDTEYNGHIHKNVIEKFAGLIIVECMDVFGQNLPEPGDGRMPEVVDRICRVAEHFGVEE